MIIDDTYGISANESNEADEIPSIPPLSSRNSIILMSQKSGWLKKQSNNALKNWSYRYFALDNHKLYYYRQPSDKSILGVLNFDQVSVDLIQNSKFITLLPSSSAHRICLKSPNLSDLQDWANLLLTAIMTSRGKIRNLTSMGTRGKFWKFERMAPADFLEDSDTGDILLFRSQDLASTLTRSVVNSKYDHVAFVIKYVSGKIGLLEATNADGVGILMWEDFIQNDCHKAASRVMYRQLKVERSDEMMMKLEEFVKKVDGKRFKISPIKLLQRSSSDKPGEEDSFFCSELVASAYKAMGLLSSDIPASSYWPRDFSDEKQLGLIGARLGREILIDFDLTCF